MTNEQIKAEIVRRIGCQFRTFGGGRVRDESNPIAVALKDRPLQFAAGIDVAEVVHFVLGVEKVLREQG